MRKQISIVWVFYVFMSGMMLRAQADAKPAAFGISFSGYLRTDVFYDSRQTVSIREGHFFLYPKGETPDKAGRDINGKSNFNMLSIQTRLVGKITGPDAFGAKTSGLVEGEFFGHSDGDINGFRLRHAYVKLNWERTELLIGQFWHAMFITECFPDVVSFNTGAPFLPFSRNPQIRLTRRFGKLSLIATAMAQRDFVSAGPGGASSTFLRNAVVPELNITGQYSFKSPGSGNEGLFGAGLDYKKIIPRLTTTANYRTDESLADLSGMAFFKYRTSGLTFKAESVYGKNLYHLTMLGGYGTRAVLDPTTGFESYSSLKNFSAWGEIQTNGTKFQVGVFAGYTRNLGAEDEIPGASYTRGPDIARIVRISPRAIYNAGKLRLAGEIEYTAAAYGIPDLKGVVRDAKSVANLRILGAVYYFF